MRSKERTTQVVLEFKPVADIATASKNASEPQTRAFRLAARNESEFVSTYRAKSGARLVFYKTMAACKPLQAFLRKKRARELRRRTLKLLDSWAARRSSLAPHHTPTTKPERKAINPKTLKHQSPQTPKTKAPKPQNPKTKAPKPQNPEDQSPKTPKPKPQNPKTLKPKPQNAKTLKPKPQNPKTLKPLKA